MEKITHSGRIIEVVEHEVEHKGKKKIFEVARRSPGTRLIIPKGDTILITSEFRHEIGAYDYRLPGGKVFDTLDEYHAALINETDINVAAANAAIKEAHEEVGVEVESLSLFHKSTCGATMVWDLFYFVVGKFTESEQHLEEGEDITFQYIPREKVKEMCFDGSISEERSALTLLRFIEGR